MSKKFASAGDVLQSLFLEGKSPLAAEFGRWRLWRKWGEIVGPTISAQSEPVGMRDGVLYVWVKNSSWMQQLIFLAKPIKEKVNAYLGPGKVKMVRFTLDRREVPTLAEADPRLKEFLANGLPNADGDPPPGQ